MYGVHCLHGTWEVVFVLMKTELIQQIGQPIKHSGAIYQMTQINIVAYHA